MISIPALTVTVCCVLAQADANLPPSSRQDFEEYCKSWEGRWIGDVTWVADWPGLGKKGDKVTAYFDAKIIEDGNALLARFHGGNGSATLLTVYDPARKLIKERYVISNGFVSDGVIYKQDGAWHFRDSGALADGRKTTAIGKRTTTDGGNTHTLTSTGTLDGKPTDPQNDVWRRVSKK